MAKLPSYSNNVKARTLWSMVPKVNARAVQTLIAAIVIVVLVQWMFFAIYTSTAMLLPNSNTNGSASSNSSQTRVQDDHTQIQPNSGDNYLDSLLARQSSTLNEAETRYKVKLGRSPPNGYAGWFKTAQEKKCLIDDYELIWDDMAPYYQLGGDEFRRRMNVLKRNAPKALSSNIRNGVVAGSAIWKALLKNSIKNVPDLDFIINDLDEPRIIFNLDRSGPGLLEAEAKLTPSDANQRLDEKPEWFSMSGTDHLKLMKEECHIHDPNRPLEQVHETHGYFQSPMSTLYSRKLLPILSHTRISNCFRDIIVPSIYYYSLYAGGASKADRFPWNERKSVIYWRGATSGGHAKGGNWHNFHRTRLAKLAMKHPDMMDMKITRAVQCDFQDCADMRKELDISASEPFETVYNYKYAMDIDGNSFSGRFFRLLESGSLVFKMTIFNEYFERWIVPWEHYIPVAVDLSDLEEKITWARNNDAEARRIAESGRRFSERILNKPQMECYTELLLLEMSNLWNSVELYWLKLDVWSIYVFCEVVIQFFIPAHDSLTCLQSEASSVTENARLSSQRGTIQWIIKLTRSQPKLPFKMLVQPRPPAPAWFYAATFGIGLCVGIALEASMIKLGYYELLVKGESKRRAQQAEEDAQGIVRPTLQW
ncbi:hypothetical protein BASA83_010455 [Batrachochytrium salamandrivorans]|nr:hypothetical protein BASA83_010455 [Batrachochytrium salamandrivorans]